MTVLDCRRGRGHPTVPGGPAHLGVAWRPTTSARVLSADEARGLSERGERPAPDQLLQVAARPAPGPWTLTLRVPFAGRPPVTHEFPFEVAPAGLDAAGAFAVSFAFVAGPVDGLTLPEVTPIDVAEASDGSSWVPQVELGAPGGEPVPIALEGGAPPPEPEPARALLRGLHYETDKAFLLPSAMRGLGQLKRILAARPGTALLVVGHADSAGSADHNRDLSDERARSMLQYLRDDVDGWLAFYGKPKASLAWGRREDQLMLSALPGGDAPPHFAGAPTGQDDAATAAATKAFQRSSNATRGTSLQDDGILGPLTRRELVLAYLALDGQTLAPETVTATHGCGEFHPDEPTADGVASEANRRAELFLFPTARSGDRSAIDPAPQARCPAPGCGEYAAWREQAKTTIDLSQRPVVASFVVSQKDTARLLEDATVELAGLERLADQTDGLGLATFDDVLPGDYQVVARKPGFAPTLLAFSIGADGVAPQERGEAPRALTDGGEAAPAGDAPTPLTLTRQAPRFVGRAGKAGQAGKRVVFAQGDPITLEWSFGGPLPEGTQVLVEGASAQAVEAGAKRLPPFRFADFPAAADGTWSLVTVQGGQRTVEAQVEGIGVTLLEAVSPPDEPDVLLDQLERPHEPALGRPLPPGGLDPLGDAAGVIAEKRAANGKPIEPGHAARYRWSICAPPDSVVVVLEVLRNSTKQFPDEPPPLRRVEDKTNPMIRFDVTASASRDLGAPATFDVREETGISWDVVLHLLTPGTTPLTGATLPRERVLASSVLRLFIGRPKPGLLDAELVAGDGAFKPGQVATVGREANGKVRWTIQNHEARNAIEVVVVKGTHAKSAGLTPVFPPEEVPAREKTASGEHTLVHPLPKEDGDYTLFLRLRNLANAVFSEKAITVRVADRAVVSRLRLVRADVTDTNRFRGIGHVPLVARSTKGGEEQRTTTDEDGFFSFTLELPMRLSCPLVELLKDPAKKVNLSGLTAWAPEERRAPKEPDAPDEKDSPAQEEKKRTVQRFIRLVRKLELAHPEWDASTVVGALRKIGGYDNAAFQGLYGLPPQPKIEPVKAPFGVAPLGATQVVVHCKEHVLAPGESLEGVAKAHGLTRAQLTRFNWATDDPARVDLCMGALLGCRSVGPDGRYVLKDEDQPRTIHVPLPWEQELKDTSQLEVRLFPCAPPWPELLSAAEIVELEWRFSRHATDKEIDDADSRRHAFKQGRLGNGRADGIPEAERQETGLALDRPGGEWVALGHVMTGIAAGLNRFESLDYGRKMFPVPVVGTIFPNIDNLYTATIGGDLGQEAVLHHKYDDKLRLDVPFVGVGTESTDAETNGDIDGFLLGWMLSPAKGSPPTGGDKQWLQGIGRTFPGTMRTSELLERFYGERADMQLTGGGARTRYALFKAGAICPPAKLLTESRSFAVLYKAKTLQEKAPFYEVKPVAEAAVKFFHDQWLAKRKDR